MEGEHKRRRIFLSLSKLERESQGINIFSELEKMRQLSLIKTRIHFAVFDAKAVLYIMINKSLSALAFTRPTTTSNNLISFTVYES